MRLEPAGAACSLSPQLNSLLPQRGAARAVRGKRLEGVRLVKRIEPSPRRRPSGLALSETARPGRLEATDTLQPGCRWSRVQGACFCSSHQPGLNFQPGTGGKTKVISCDGGDVNKNHARISTSLTAFQLFSSESKMRSGEIVPKSISFLQGSKPDVIQPNLPRNEIVELLAWQADKLNHDQFGLWPGREIQEQRGPSVARPGQIVS